MKIKDYEEEAKIARTVIIDRKSENRQEKEKDRERERERKKERANDLQTWQTRPRDPG